LPPFRHNATLRREAQGRCRLCSFLDGLLPKSQPVTSNLTASGVCKNRDRIPARVTSANPLGEQASRLHWGKGRPAPSASTEIARVGPTTADLSLENDLVISCVFMSEERFATEQSPLLINVRREGVTA